MDDLLIARSQMALSLAFHIVFAAIGIGLPLLMVIAEALGWRTGDRAYEVLARRWAKGTAVLFAVGAVSGTVLSFELGLLWPTFMEYAGPIIGMPFSLEGFAFFLEAIFLGIYLYGWERISRPLHLAAGAMVALCGTMSGVFVVSTNAWMNTPQGFTLDEGGRVIDVRPFEAMFNPSFLPQALHMTVAAFLALAIGVAAVHAWGLLQDAKSRFHGRGYAIALTVAAGAGVIMPATGHVAGETVAHYQPVKLAAMEAHWETERGASFIIGGWPDTEAEETRWALRVPYLLSVIAHGDPNAEVMGLRDVPRDLRPPVPVVHVAFQVMIAIGVWLAALGAFVLAYLAWYRTVPQSRPVLWAVLLSGPSGMVAIEAGWVVTEVGRQPWIIQGSMRTADAVTPMPGLMAPFVTFLAVYLALALVVVALMRRFFMASPSNADIDGPEVVHGA